MNYLNHLLRAITTYPSFPWHLIRRIKPDAFIALLTEPRVAQPFITSFLSDFYYAITNGVAEGEFELLLTCYIQNIPHGTALTEEETAWREYMLNLALNLPVTFINIVEY